MYGALLYIMGSWPVQWDTTAAVRPALLLPSPREGLGGSILLLAAVLVLGAANLPLGAAEKPLLQLLLDFTNFWVRLPSELPTPLLPARLACGACAADPALVDRGWLIAVLPAVAAAVLPRGVMIGVAGAKSRPASAKTCRPNLATCQSFSIHSSSWYHTGDIPQVATSNTQSLCC